MPRLRTTLTCLSILLGAAIAPGAAQASAYEAGGLMDVKLGRLKVKTSWISLRGRRDDHGPHRNERKTRETT